MLKINFNSLKNYINNSDYYITTGFGVDRLKKRCLSLWCLCGLSDDEQEFATVYEDGTVHSLFGSTNIFELMENDEELHNEDGEFLEDLVDDEVIFDYIISCVQCDMEDLKSFIEDISSAIEG